MNYNHSILVGRLTRDPEIRYLESGSPVCNFTLASNRSYGKGEEKKEESLFLDVVVWGSQGELMASSLVKGSSVLVDGRLQQQRWETDAGENRSKIVLVANSVQFLDKKGDA